MGNHSIAKMFTGGEIQKIGDKLYPRINGRLRLCHEDCHNLSIATSLIKFDGKTAIVKAVSTTTKGSFTGHGMASIERDENSDLSIVELAENRAIARALRISGYGLELRLPNHSALEKLIKATLDPKMLLQAGLLTCHCQFMLKRIRNRS